MEASVAPPQEDEGWAAVTVRLVRLAWPIVLARIGIQTMGLADAVFVGRFSARELGYHALGWAPTAIVLTTAVGLLMGVQVMAARRVGEGKPERAGAVLRRGLVYALLLGVGCTAALVWGGPPLLGALGLEADLARGSGRALQVFSLSLTPYLISVALAAWLEGLGRPRPGMWAMLWANLLNVALNFIFVPGAFGLPAGGAVGAGWATLGSRVLLAVLLAVYVWRLPEARATGVFERPAPEPEAAAEQRRIGYGAGASYFVEAGAFLGMNVVAGWLGAREVAAWAVVLNYTALVFMVPLGLAGATAVLVGNAYGAGDRRGVVRAAGAGFAVVTAVGAAVSLITVPAAALIAGAYATDVALVSTVAAAFVLAAPYFAPDALQAVAAQALRARGDVLIPTGIHVLCYAVVMLPLGWWLAHPGGMGLSGCIWAVIVASFAAAGGQLGRFAWVTWRDRPLDPERLRP